MGCFEVLESGEGIQEEIARRLQNTGALACGWASPSRPVSYGPGPRDTLTLSSREGDLLWLALQREVVTVQGQVVERQEFPFRSTAAQPTQAALAVAGALLLLGVRPEHLS